MLFYERASQPMVLGSDQLHHWFSLPAFSHIRPVSESGRTVPALSLFYIGDCNLPAVLLFSLWIWPSVTEHMLGLLFPNHPGLRRIFRYPKQLALSPQKPVFFNIADDHFCGYPTAKPFLPKMDVFHC